MHNPQPVVRVVYRLTAAKAQLTNGRNRSDAETLCAFELGLSYLFEVPGGDSLFRMRINRQRIPPMGCCLLLPNLPCRTSSMMIPAPCPPTTSAFPARPSRQRHLPNPPMDSNSRTAASRHRQRSPSLPGFESCSAFLDAKAIARRTCVSLCTCHISSVVSYAIRLTLWLAFFQRRRPRRNSRRFLTRTKRSQRRIPSLPRSGDARWLASTWRRRWMYQSGAAVPKALCASLRQRRR